MRVRATGIVARLVLSLCGLTPFWACGGSDDPSPAPLGGAGAGGVGGFGGNGVTPAQPANTPIPDPNLQSAGAGGEAFRDPLCGSDTCMPDDPDSCAGVEVEAPPAQEGAGGGSDDAPQTPALAACRVVANADRPIAVCTVAGSGELDAPCFSTNDCGAGLACIGGGLAGRCRPFCCGGEGSCKQPGTYCSRQPQRELDTSTGESPLIVPVCVPADDCDLGEPFPCPSGRSCDCAEGRACMVVRTEPSGNQTGTGSGTTACVEPGEGAKGEPCPCAFGHVCSAASGVCLELCLTVSPDDESAENPCDGRCQASSELPPGWGVCIR